jgi:hypothetical protein
VRALKVRLVDVDSKMANMALMKISSYYKQKGRDVGWHNPIIDGKVDILYIAKVFDFTDDYLYSFADKIVKGGTGYDITSRLPGEIDNVKALDYSIYSDCDYSIQFFSRGCIRSCPFCIVREKEGDIRPAEPMELNPSGERIEVLDNNFFANPEWKSAITQLLKWNQPVNFHGIDARIMTEEHSYYLNQLKHYKQIHIAWDNPKENILPKLKHITRWIKPYKLMCYVLIGYWSTPEEDLYRVETLRGLGVDPFVMPFDKSDPYQRKFARWVNHKAIFKTVKWEDYVA